MAKRYHQSRKDRMHEAVGEKLHHMKDKFNDEMHHDADGERSGSYKYDRQSEYRREDDQYAGRESRRHKEMMDAGMIHEDHHAIANLPQEVMIKPYPKTGPYNPEVLDDTLRGVDRQMDYDDSKRREHFFPKKV